MKKMKIIGMLLIATGLVTIIFSAILFLANFNLMEHLPTNDQYLMAMILSALFIGMGFMLIHEE
jgi:uncharacterized membrane protein